MEIAFQYSYMKDNFFSVKSFFTLTIQFGIVFLKSQWRGVVFTKIVEWWIAAIPAIW